MTIVKMKDKKSSSISGAFLNEKILWERSCLRTCLFLLEIQDSSHDESEQEHEPKRPERSSCEPCNRDNSKSKTECEKQSQNPQSEIDYLCHKRHYRSQNTKYLEEYHRSSEYSKDSESTKEPGDYLVFWEHAVKHLTCCFISEFYTTEISFTFCNVFREGRTVLFREYTHEGHIWEVTIRDLHIS